MKWNLTQAYYTKDAKFPVSFNIKKRFLLWNTLQNQLMVSRADTGELIIIPVMVSWLSFDWLEKISQAWSKYLWHRRMRGILVS